MPPFDFLLTGFEIESDNGKIFAISGGIASLPCNITPPIQDDNVTLVLWYKGLIEKPIYGFDARLEDENRPEHFVKPDLEGRANFSWNRSPASLDIIKVQEADAGVYRCRVDFFRSRTVHYKATLVIIVPPRKPVIMDENGQSLKGLVGPYNEGSRLHITCEVEGGKPTPIVKWWRGLNLLKTESEVGPGGVIRTELILDKLRRDQQDSRFTCEATNNNITQPPSTDITLDMNFKPLVVKISSSKEPLSANKKKKLFCESSGSKPPAVMTWWKGSRKLKMTEYMVSESGNSSTSVLTFTPSSSDNGKYLSCRADNPTIPGSAMEDGWKLKIYHQPEILLRIEGGHTVGGFVEGNDVFFSCSISADPWVRSISWYLNGNQLTQNSSDRMIILSQSLQIQKITRKDKGTYICTAVNDEGQGKSNPVDLKVKYKPVCGENSKKIYVVSKQEAARVSCEVDSNPAVTSFRWTFNGSNVQEKKIDSFTIRNGKSMATYMPRTTHDYGDLNCWAKNDLGEQSKPCVFTLIFAGAPEPLRNCSVFNQTFNSIEIQCVAGNNGGLPQLFVIEVYDRDTLQLYVNKTVVRKPYFTVIGLPPDQHFTIIVYATNAKGRSHSVDLQAGTSTYILKKEEDEDPSVRFSSLPMLIGVVVGLIIVASIIILIIKGKRRRRRQIPEEKKSQSPEIQRTSSNLLGSTIDHDFQQYDVKGPDIIPARSSGNDSGFSDFAVEDRSRKRINNISDVLYERKVYKNNPNQRISCISNDNEEEIHYAELSLVNKKQQPNIKALRTNTVSLPHQVPTEYAAIDFKASVPSENVRSGITLRPPRPGDMREDEQNITVETPLMYNQLESSV
ncbi:Uncharacterised protein g7488 [Pycnogonum litorale]